MTQPPAPGPRQQAAAHAATATELLSGDVCRCGDVEDCPYEDRQRSIAQLAQAHALTGMLWLLLTQPAPGPAAPRAARGPEPD